MAEVGIDISEMRPKSFTEVPKPVHALIAVCGKTAEECPSWPGLEVEVWDVADPSSASGGEEDQIQVFRSTRDQLRGLVHGYLVRTEGERNDD